MFSVKDITVFTWSISKLTWKEMRRKARGAEGEERRAVARGGGRRMKKKEKCGPIWQSW
jgi:hypothetical protein